MLLGACLHLIQTRCFCVFYSPYLLGTNRTKTYTMKNFNLIAILCLTPFLCFGDTFYVSTTGADNGIGTIDDPFNMIQDAIFAASATSSSDTIYLQQGIYDQTVNFNEEDGIYLMSQESGNPATIIGNGVEDLPMVSIHNSFNIRISNIIFRDKIHQDAKAIYATGRGNGLTITDNEFYNIGWGDDPTADPEAFDVVRQAHCILINGRDGTGISNVYIGRNQIHDIITGNSETITLAGNTFDFLIEDNVIEDVTNIGIDIAGHFDWAFPSELNQVLNQARSGRIRRNIVRRCRRPTPGNEPAGIYIDGGSNVIVDRNEVYDNGSGISVGCENLDKTASSVVIANNVIYNNDKFGCVFGANTGNIEVCTLRNNTFFNNGIQFDNSGSISIQKSTDGFIADNIVYLTSEDYYGISAFGYLVENLMIVRNQLYSPFGETPRVFTFSPAESSTSAIDNLPFQDPLLADVSVETPDFHLLENSPCIDQANPFFAPLPEELDFYGNEREIQFVDVGASESDFTDGIVDNIEINLQLFPNPSSKWIHFKSPNLIHRVTFCDLFGKSILTLASINSLETSCDISELPNGIYLARIETAKGDITRRVLVSR